MRTMGLVVVALLLAGCDDTVETDETDDTDDACQLGTFECYIKTDVTATGDYTCHTPGDDWLTQTVDATKQTVDSRTELVTDFEHETPVNDATVQIWYGDVVNATPDVTQFTADGQFTADIPACKPFSYKVTTPVELDQSKDTYRAHLVAEPVGDAIPLEFESVSKTTYNVIAGLMGVTLDSSSSVISGRLRDCAGVPIEGAQVVVRDDAGNIPEQLLVHYFIEDFPNRDQPHTSEDGLWVVFNIPPGEWTVEAYVSDGAGGHDLVGATKLQSYSDSINISSIYVGFGDGIWYSESCRTAR